MPERLTESHIRRGLLDTARAREAMQRQVLLGGALDTCLLELHLVDEDALLEAMGSAYGLATASALESTSAIDERAARAFPEQWAKKHTLAPVGFDGERMILTVISPAPPDVNLLVRLGELLELTLKPLLAPEFRVHQRLAMLYDEKPPERYQALIEQVGGPSAPRAHARTVDSQAPVIVTRPLTFGEAVNRLKEANDRDEIVRTALAYAQRELEFAAMFIVHDRRLDGWNAVGEGSENIGRVSLELSAGSAFRVVLDTQAHYLGPLPADDIHLEFLTQLGRPHPRAALIVPVRIKNRTIALMYGENGPRTIPPRLAADLMLFTTHVQGALETLLVRRKVESLSEPPARSARPLPEGRPKEVPPTPVAPPSWGAEVSRPGLTEWARTRNEPTAQALASAPIAPDVVPNTVVTPLDSSAPPFVQGHPSDQGGAEAELRALITAAEASVGSKDDEPPLHTDPALHMLEGVGDESIDGLPLPEDRVITPSVDVAPMIEIGVAVESSPSTPTGTSGGASTQYTFIRRSNEPKPIARIDSQSNLSPSKQDGIGARSEGTPVSKEQPPAPASVPAAAPAETYRGTSGDPDTDSLASAFSPSNWEISPRGDAPSAIVLWPMPRHEDNWEHVAVDDEISAYNSTPDLISVDRASTKNALASSAAVQVPAEASLPQPTNALRDTTNYATPYEALASSAGFEEALESALQSAVAAEIKQSGDLKELDEFSIDESESGFTDMTPTPAVLLSRSNGPGVADRPAPSPAPTRSTSAPQGQEGWDAVQVDSWDEWAQRASEAESRAKNELAKNMRASIAEDSTLPDLSAEAWLRASSDMVRPRILPPEVMERAAMDEPEEPVPLTRPARPKNEGQIDEEPVPLTRPASGLRREVVRAAQVDQERAIEDAIAIEEPVAGTRSSAGVSLTPADPGELPPPSLTVADFRLSGPEQPASETLHHTDARFDERPSTDIIDAMGRVVPAPQPERAPSIAPVRNPQLENEVNYLLDALVGIDSNARRAARDRLTAMGPFILPKMMERFPGMVTLDPFSPNAVLPPFTECGEQLSILASFANDAHPFVIKKLDAPDPRQRFFATYFYGVVFVPDAIPRLVQRLHDEEPRICMLAARTLFAYRELGEFQSVLEHLHGRLEASSIAARRHAAYLIGLFRDVSAVPLLISIFDKKEKLLFDAAEGALAEITKQRLGPNPKKWRHWWARNQTRSRIGWLVDGLGSKDTAMRRSASEELRAVTGIDLGYNEDSPKRQREDARVRWVRWWNEQYNLHHGKPDGEPVSP
jgi:hypothetical protein